MEYVTNINNMLILFISKKIFFNQVILDDCHYRSQLLAHVPPPANVRSTSACLVKMGFPHSGHGQAGDGDDSKDPLLTVCMW